MGVVVQKIERADTGLIEALGRAGYGVITTEILPSPPFYSSA